MEQGPGHHILPNGERSPKAQMTAVVLLLDQLPQMEGVVVHGRSCPEKKASALRELELLPLIPKQLGIILLLQCPDVLRYCGPGDMELLCSPGKVHRSADRQKGIDTKIQHGDPLLLYHNINL